jgi:hypothetical protein
MTRTRRSALFFLSILLFAHQGHGIAHAAPLGLPPLPPDLALTHVAPDECLLYVSLGGSGQADPASPNQAEQLLAEREVQDLARAVETAVGQAIRRQADPDDLPKIEAVWKLATAALARPAAAFISKVTASQDSPPDIEAGLVVNTGDETAQLQQAIEFLLTAAGQKPEDAREIVVDAVKLRQLPLPPGGPPVYWGVHGQYHMVAVGRPTADLIVAGLQGRRSTPEWLERLSRTLPVERRATLAYVNVRAIQQLIAPFAGREAARMLDALGISNIKSLSFVSGLEGEGLLSQGWLEIDGAPRGLLMLASGEPLQAAELRSIPSDATVAVAFRFDLAAVLDDANPLWNEVNPGLRQMARAVLAGDALGFSIPRLAKSLGSVWTIHSSPSEGGLLVSGLTLVVDVRDRADVQPALDALLNWFRRQFPQPAAGAEPGQTRAEPGQARVPTLDEIEFRGERLYVLGLADPIPLAPTFCLTAKQLIFAAYPQSIKSYLERSADSPSLAESSQVRAALGSGRSALAIVYQDTPAVLRTVYPIIEAAAPALAAELRTHGVHVSAGLLPALGTVERHLRPAVTTVSRTSEGFVLRSMQSAPLGTMATAAPLVAGLLLPAAQASRAAAVRAQATNNLKQIGIAMHNYHDVHASFPAAASHDDDDKPLLSWRVHILPFVEQSGLYNEFHLDEPWDSEHNKRLIPRMPAVYRTPNHPEIEEGKTVYLAPRGEGTMFEGFEGPRLQEITDGTSNTIMAVEASPERAVVWTAPGDFEYDAQQPLAGLGGIHANGFLTLFADGSVHFISQSVDLKVLKALFTATGGEPISQ